NKGISYKSDISDAPIFKNVLEYVGVKYDIIFWPLLKSGLFLKSNLKVAICNENKQMSHSQIQNP
ncbi:MAG TPA: hypothetical protein VGK38_15250, partial [Prolixibacteraceae bacterium]